MDNPMLKPQYVKISRMPLHKGPNDVMMVYRTESGKLFAKRFAGRAPLHGYDSLFHRRCGKGKQTMVVKKMQTTIKRKKVQFAYYDEDAEVVSVVGDFNGWDEAKHVMSRDKDNIWRKTLMLPIGVYEYRFKVDDRWENDPQNDRFSANCFGTSNNVLEVG